MSNEYVCGNPKCPECLDFMEGEKEIKIKIVKNDVKSRDLHPLVRKNILSHHIVLRKQIKALKIKAMQFKSLKRELELEHDRIEENMYPDDNLKIPICQTMFGYFGMDHDFTDPVRIKIDDTVECFYNELQKIDKIIRCENNE